MGSGKSTVGKALAARTGRRYVDNDDALLAATGQTARQLQEELGADRLHELEVDALALALDDVDPAIIGAAAAVVTVDEGLRQLGRAAHVVWLHADPEVLAARVLSGPDHRPVGDDAVSLLAGQLTERAPAYDAVATVRVDDTGTPEQIAATILEAIGP